jgi:hypothetical protein
MSSSQEMVLDRNFERMGEKDLGKEGPLGVHLKKIIAL